MLPSTFAYPAPIPKKPLTAWRGDRVRLTEAAREKAEIPYGQGDGVILDVMVENGKAVLLIEIRLARETREIVSSVEDVTKE